MSTVRKPSDTTRPAESVLTPSVVAHPDAVGGRPLSGSEAEPGDETHTGAVAGATETDANDASGNDDPWKVLDALSEAERRFVMAALQGQDWSDCGRAAGIRTELGVIRWIGRPRIRAAFERLAPYVAASDPKRAARLMLPYASVRLLSTVNEGSDAQATAAVKEILSIAGVTVHRSEHVTASLADVLKALGTRRMPVETPRKRLASAEIIEGSATDVTDSKSVSSEIWGRALPADSREGGDEEPGADEPVKRGRGRGRRRK